MEEIVFGGVREECLSCLSRLIDKTVRLAAASPEVEERARKEAFKILKEQFKPGAIPAFIATSFQERIKDITGNHDPFLELKRKEMKIARTLAEYLRPMYGDDMRELFAFSALGNALDFFRDPEELRKDGEKGVGFCINDIMEAESIVNDSGGIVLLLADNAGEIYFDFPLLQYLQKKGCDARYVVKEGPIQNDLTLDDVRWAGYDKTEIPVISHGASVVGLDLEKVNSDFRTLFNSAALVIGKGMGHFETMSHIEANARLLFLLKAKCGPVAMSLGVDKDCFAALLK